MSLYKRPLSAGTAVILSAVAIAVLVFGVSTLRADANAVAALPAPLPVSAIEARYDGEARIEEFYPGLVSARRQSALGFERGGRIDAIGVDVGDLGRDRHVGDCHALLAEAGPRAGARVYTLRAAARP